MNTRFAGRHPSTLLYRFLMSPQMRPGRYALLVAALIIITLNQVWFMYQDSLEMLGGWVYVLVGIMLVTVLPIVCFDLYFLIPRLLMKKRYVAYFAALSFLVVGMLGVLRAQEYIVYSLLPHTVAATSLNMKMEMVFNYISSFLMNLICMVGISVTVLLKLWMKDHKRVAQLEKKQLRSELEQLKQQISPDLLFKVLHEAGLRAVPEPDGASLMLIKLSRILRYQLYDCSRAWVLLSAEITFLTHYLDLEQQLSGKISYTFSSSGEAGLLFVPPLLFIPYVQLAVEQANRQREKTDLNIYLEAATERVVFICRCPGLNLSPAKELEKSRQRLTLLYKEHYALKMEKESICLELIGGAQWKS